MNNFNKNKTIFNIDQNKQKINMLLKKKKEQDDKCDEIENNMKQIETEIDMMEGDIKIVQDNLSQLQEQFDNLPIGGDDTANEEIKLQSYDVYKTRDMTHWNDKWEPLFICFCADRGTKFKFRVKFDAISSYDKTITTTATIVFDEEIVFSETLEIDAGGKHSVDFEYYCSSTEKGHRIKITLLNTEGLVNTSCSCVPEFLTVELWGTNVQFTSRSNDFHVVPADQNVVMSTTIFNSLPMFCIQPAGENLSFEESAFRTIVTNNYRNFNQVIPHCYHGYDETAGRVVFRDVPSIALHSYVGTSEKKRVDFYTDIVASETEIVKYSAYTYTFSVVRPLLTNEYRIYMKKEFPSFVILSHDRIVYMYTTINGLMPVCSNEDKTYPLNCDICGTLRLDNFEPNMDKTGVFTKCDGESYFWFSNAATVAIKPQMLPIGFGTHPNSYLLANGDVVVFLRVGTNIKKITLEKNKDDGLYFIKDTSIIEDAQEYWLAPNGSHFERKGNKICYYLKDATVPSKTLNMYC